MAPDAPPFVFGAMAYNNRILAIGGVAVLGAAGAAWMMPPTRLAAAPAPALPTRPPVSAPAVEPTADTGSMVPGVMDDRPTPAWTLPVEDGERLSLMDKPRHHHRARYYEDDAEEDPDAGPPAIDDSYTEQPLPPDEPPPPPYPN